MVVSLQDGDTIAAIGTPYGESGIGIVRISGPNAKGIIQRVFKPRRGGITLRSHQIRYGEIRDPERDVTIDDVLVTYMVAPRTYTREDVAEINCHGGVLVLQSVLELVLREGARQALPGEFTMRAFCNGRIDLTQAEAVLDIIQAKTAEGLLLAREQLRGKLSQEVLKLRDSVLETLVAIEAHIDFSDEDIDPPSREKVAGELRANLAKVSGLIKAYSEGEIYRYGVKIAIVGKANVGKSSLFNQLLDRKRAIVTPIAGTTTDVIEETINLSGVPVRLMDMAGVGEPRDEIEQEGLRVAGEAVRDAQVILLVLDGSCPLDPGDERVLQKTKESGAKTVVVLNKIDLPAVLGEAEITSAIGTAGIVSVSALTGKGIGELRQRMVDTIAANRAESTGATGIPVNVRQKNVLERSRYAIQESLNAVDKQVPWDLTALEIRRTLDLLGDVVGETTPQDVLEKIFAQFCIGK